MPLSLAAAPLNLEPSQWLDINDSYFTSIEDVDIDGDFLIMGVRRTDPLTDGGHGEYYTDAAFLYKRYGDGSFGLVRKLFEERVQREDDGRIPLTVAMENGIAVVNAFRTLTAYERMNDDFVAVPIEGHARGKNMEIDSGTILGSESSCGWGGQTRRKNAAGTYATVGWYSGEFSYCDDGQIAGDSDIWGTRVIIPQPEADDSSFVPSLWVWEGSPPSTPTAIPVIGPSSIEGDWISIAGTRDSISGTHFFRRQGLGNWLAQQTITMPDAMLAPLPSVYDIGSLQMDDGFVLQGRSGNVDVFQRDASSKYQYVAKLLGADRRPSISGRTAIAIAANRVNLYDLPQNLVQPELRQDDFQDGNAADWTPQAGGNFSVVAAANGSYVYRQSSLAGNASSILGNSDLTSQAIQADVTPTGFNGSDRWFGLVARYTDASNYYYVTVRQSNVIEIRRMVNGQFESRGSVPFTVGLNRTYSLRLEAVGPWLRVYVDNRRIMEAYDSTHTHGQVGLMTYRTSADYDNVTVSTQKFLPLLTDDFAAIHPNRWTESGGTWGQSNGVYVQSSLTGARSITGIATGDQMVQVRVRPTSFATGTERWFGVIARYVDASNYYYVTLRSNNRISLRRLVNGVIQELDSAPLTVSAGTVYRVRLDAIGTALRVWVNGKHVLEATDSTFAQGKYGLALYKTSAQFDDFVAAQP